MHGVKKLLLVDDSRVILEMLTHVLRPHCDVLLSAACFEDGMATLEEHRDLSLVICDVVLPDGDGFELLRRSRELSDPPEVLLLTARACDADRARALEMGALEYLTKPIAFKDIAAAWRRCQKSDWAPRPRIRRPPIAHVLLVDPDEGSSSVVRWEIHDISQTGAFLATNGPVEIGSEVTLELMLDDVEARISAVVTRVQDPSWAAVGGVAVRFGALDSDARALLAELHRRYGDHIS